MKQNIKNMTTLSHVLFGTALREISHSLRQLSQVFHFDFDGNLHWWEINITIGCRKMVARP